MSKVYTWAEMHELDDLSEVKRTDRQGNMLMAARVLLKNQSVLAMLIMSETGFNSKGFEELAELVGQPTRLAEFLDNLLATPEQSKMMLSLIATMTMVESKISPADLEAMLNDK